MVLNTTLLVLQAFGVADSGDSVYAIKKHVFDDKDITFAELKEAMDANFGYPVDGEVAPCAASAETEIEKDLYDQICKILGKEGINTIRALLLPLLLVEATMKNMSVFVL